MKGYQSSQYAESLREFGTPRLLPRSAGWVLQRRIPGSPACDAMGCYPLFSCQNWAGLSEDLAELENDLVSVGLVPDPFDDFQESALRAAFADRVVPLKQHFVVDLSQPAQSFVSKHHQYYAKRALKGVTVEAAPTPAEHINEWESLYACLRARHGLTGIKAFSKDSFARQLATPGVVMFRALQEGVAVGAHVWYVHSNETVATSHLAAFSEAGYTLMASYALYWGAIAHFAERVRWLNLGAGAGTRPDANDGLTVFKRGWSTGTRTAYFCGRILSSSRYREIVRARGVTDTNYFPAYRAGEFE